MDTQTLRAQFDAVAAVYDQQRPLLIPCYADFYAAGLPWLQALPMGSRVLDLGAGTGLFSYLVYQQRPDLQLTLVDIAPQMLAVARQRFAGLPQVSFQEVDFTRQSLPGRYEAIISSLAIHHLPSPAKADLYQRCYAALEPGGFLLNADQVAGRTPGVDAWLRRQWRATVQTSGLTPEAIAQAFARTQLDDFDPLEAQLRMLEQAGFEEVD